MTSLEGIRARLGLLFARRAAESRMDVEFRFHLEMETEKNIREGMDPKEARRRAAIAFGGVERHKEEMREDRGLAWLGGLSFDLKLGLRMLAKSPGLTLVGVIGMAVAIAIGAVSFAIIYTFIGTTVPLDDGEQLVMIQNVDARRNLDRDETHLHDLVTWREALRAVEDLGAYRTLSRNLITRGARPEPVRVAEMTASGFRIARVPALLGRYFHDEDERPGATPVVVIGYSVWQNRFAGAADVIGRTIQLGATVHTVIGVMPPGFAFPVNNRVWTPLRLNPSAFERGEAPPIQVFGRLAPTATIEDARAQLTTIARRLAAAYPQSHEHVRVEVLPYALSFFDSPEMVWALHLLQLLISMLLVVIGTNVATLVYARTASRMGEIAVRTALGASRGRVVAQLFTEGFVLSATAAAVGLGGAALVLRSFNAAIVRTGGEQIPYWMRMGVSPGMVLYVAGLTVVAAMIVGVVPALKATDRRVQANLQHLGVGGSGIRLGKTWTVLIVAQVAVAVAILPIVLYAAFVDGRGEAIEGPRIPTTEWITAALHLDQDAARAPAKEDAAFASRYIALQGELVRRLEAEPGVSDVVLASAVPGDEPTIRIEVDSAVDLAKLDSAAPAAPAGRAVRRLYVDVRFFRAFGIPVLAGRGFEGGDAAAQATAVIVNRSFVRQILNGTDPLGRRVREVVRRDDGSPENAPKSWYEIVGVVADFPSPEGASDLRPKLYHALFPGVANPVTIAVRVKAAAPAAFTGQLPELAVAVDPALRLADVRALDDASSLERVADRLVFSGVALATLSVILLSAAGIYALMSFTIARRRREIGIRAALGAGPRHVLGGVFSRAAGQIAIGIVIGTAVAGLVVHGKRGALVLVAVAAFMAIVGLAAALGPARRALRIQPTEALKAD
jgi:putative ABC transport system permease protein